MPEGDTIFRSARALDRALTGRKVTAFETALAPLASTDDSTPVAGRVVDKVEARGKWLLVHFSGDLVLVTHMLMSGSWHIYRVGERWRRPKQSMRVVVRNEEFEAIAFDVPVAKFYTERTLERNTVIPKLGPDLLGAEFAEDEAAARIRARPDEEIAVVLLNQQVMAGIGNVYKSEICFACGVHPFRLAGSLTAEEIGCLIHQGRRLLALNVKEGVRDGVITYSGARRTTGNSDPGSRLWVYGRQGRECRRCGTAILTRKQGAQARSTYWCPQCQPGDVAVAGWAVPSKRKKVGCS